MRAEKGQEWLLPKLFLLGTNDVLELALFEAQKLKNEKTAISETVSVDFGFWAGSVAVNCLRGILSSLRFVNNYEMRLAIVDLRHWPPSPSLSIGVNEDLSILFVIMGCRRLSNC